MHTTLIKNAGTGDTIFESFGPAINIPKIPTMEANPCVVRIPKSACRRTSTARSTVTPTTLLLFPVK